ncbi:NUDIX hydrolase [Jiella marina]|uniref:NUDIX hydrolase n=1 Tax=Jiella sp. LLJ827 TaxID=2917712 RepID=UPI002100845D|nr:NUDIX domain-containing protein [Jiella sp. LLJ827]MCQ0986980.1 NUDIX domain-containing protein [Jiella sp. LLJ827]
MMRDALGERILGQVANYGVDQDAVLYRWLEFMRLCKSKTYTYRGPWYEILAFFLIPIFAANSLLLPGIISRIFTGKYGLSHFISPSRVLDDIITLITFSVVVYPLAAMYSIIPFFVGIGAIHSFRFQSRTSFAIVGALSGSLLNIPVIADGHISLAALMLFPFGGCLTALGYHLVVYSSRAIHVAALILIRADGKTLLVRKRGKRRFMPPGGKPERLEIFREAAVREASEELGVKLNLHVLSKHGVYTSKAANEKGRKVVAHVFSARYDEPIVAGTEIEEAIWIDPRAKLAVPLAPLTEEHILPLCRELTDRTADRQSTANGRQYRI